MKDPIYYLILENGTQTEMHVISQEDIEQDVADELQAQMITPEQWLETWPYKREPDAGFVEMGFPSLLRCCGRIARGGPPSGPGY